MARNDPCHCGSGKKNKECCGRLASTDAGSGEWSVLDALQAALEHHRAGRLSQAEVQYRKILQTEPNQSDALHNLGLIASQMGKHEIAVEFIGKAISAKPSDPIYHGNLGLVFQNQGKFDEAVASCHKALSLRPDFAVAHHNLGNALMQQGKLDDAVASYRKALSFKPDHVEAHYNLGVALRGQGKLDEAVASYREALSFRPDFAAAHYNLGNALKEQGKLDEAVASYRGALSFRPDLAEAHYNLGNALQQQGKLSEAVASYRQALALKPDSAVAHNNLGNALRELGQLDEAIASYRQAISFQPDYVEAHSNLIYALNFDPAYEPHDVFRAHLEWARVHAEALPRLVKQHANERSVDRVVRIGYVSPNFRNHAATYFFEPVLACHDMSRFEIFCYSDVLRGDEYTARLREYGARWRECAQLTDAELAETILRDKIDILVDLSGHTDRHRLLVFARKAAPVQVTSRYANTTGMSAMDFRITDAFADPPGMTEHLHTEQLIRMPDSFSVFRPPEDGPAVNELPAARSGRLTFGSFNALSKIGPQVISAWSRILNAVSGSRLLISRVPDAPSRDRIFNLFSVNGIEPSRLELCGRLAPYEFLALHHKADIALDPFPFSGCTTTCHSLWMGLPVVTLAGTSHVSRVGVSMLTNVGLTRMIANSVDDYVNIASGLAEELENLSACRRSLRNRVLNSPLTDARCFTRHLEDRFRQIWASWCSQPTPP